MARTRRLWSCVAACAGVVTAMTPGPAGAIDAVVRVNAGGPGLTGTPAWAADTRSAPSPYVNAVEAGNITLRTKRSVAPDGSVPAGTPAKLFASAREDGVGGAPLRWALPVDAGPYEVRLYFAEIAGARPGERVFDVAVEGAVVLDDWDVAAAVGRRVGVMRSTTVVPTGAIDIELRPQVGQPMINGLEVLATGSTSPPPGGGGFRFDDATAALGLVEPLTGMFVHAVAWGEVNGDGWPDLFVGTFADKDRSRYAHRGATGPSPDRLLLGGPGGFVRDDTFPTMFGRSSGAAFADLDGDGDQDLVVSRHYKNVANGTRGSEVLRNDSGRFALVPGAGLPVEFGGRSIGVLDADADGRLDLFLSEATGTTGGSSRFFRNQGDLRFADRTTAAGLPLDIRGLGVGVSDLTADGRPDLFVGGSNRLFVNAGTGTYREVNGAVPPWERFSSEDDAAGVSIADVNRDGWPDLLVGHHYNSTLAQDRRVPVRLYLHRGLDAAGSPKLEDVTAASGLVALPTKAPHVELADLDADGWPDVVTSASAESGARPALFRHGGLSGGVPRFEAPTGLGSAQYWVGAPTADTDRDGRLDLFLSEYDPAKPSLLLRNTGATGAWLRVEVDGQAVGSVVTAYEPGGLGDPARLVMRREIVATAGYTAGVEAVAFLGLGARSSCDLVVTRPDGSRVEHRAVPTGQALRIS